MSAERAEAESTKKIFPASVVGVINKTHVVINRGTADDVDTGQRFLLYMLSQEEILDPTTNESLGRLEIPKGTGEVINAQEHMSTIQSDEYPPSYRVIKRGGFSMGEEEHITPSKNPRPFSDPKVGDYAKPIFY